MKKRLAFFIAGVVFFGAYPAQNANAQNVKNEQRIIGTWVHDVGDNTWIFSADGNLTWDGAECKFAVADTKLAVQGTWQADNTLFLAIFNIFMSFDGKTLILEMTFHSHSRNLYTYWLTKRI